MSGMQITPEEWDRAVQLLMSGAVTGRPCDQREAAEAIITALLGPRLPDGTPRDDHGEPAFTGICDLCGLPSLVVYGYTEAAGPCQLWPYAEDNYGEPMELGDPRLDGGGLMCSNCVAVDQFCVDHEACRRNWPPGGDPDVLDPGQPPAPRRWPDAPPGLPPWRGRDGEAGQ